MTSLLFLTAIAALGLTLGEDYGPSEGTPSPTKNPTVFLANPILFAVSWVNTAAVIFISSIAPGRIINYVMWLMSLVRSWWWCVRKGWGGGRELWTLPHSSFSGSWLFCVRYSLSRPSYGRRPGYETQHHSSCGIPWLDAPSLSHQLMCPPSPLLLWPSGRDRRSPSILPFFHQLWAGGDRFVPLCCGWYPTKYKGASKKGTETLTLYFIASAKECFRQRLSVWFFAN